MLMEVVVPFLVAVAFGVGAAAVILMAILLLCGLVGLAIRRLDPWLFPKGEKE